MASFATGKLRYAEEKVYSVEMMTHLCLQRTILPSELRTIIFSFMYVAIDNTSIREAVMLWKSEESRPLAWQRYGNISYWETTRVTDMSKLFALSNFNYPIGDWDMSNVTNMHGMFCGAILFNQPIGKWNVSKVTNMGSMFYGAKRFNQPLEKWDVSNVTRMNHMFLDAARFNQPLEQWDVSNVVNMGCMFYHATDFNQPLENWNISNVRNMTCMFYNARNFSQSLANWDVSNVKQMKTMFDGAMKSTEFPQLQ